MAKKKPQLGNLMDAMAMKPMPKATAKKKVAKKPTTKCKKGC